MNVSLDKVLSSDQLPSLPAVALRIIKLVQEPEPDFDKIVGVVKSDPAICAKVLRTVNSSLFGFRKRVSSVEAAVPILGATFVQTIVLGFTLADHQSPSADQTEFYQRHWRRSLTQAVAAESLALKTGCDHPAEFFIVGLLQDIGELALLTAFPDEYTIHCLNGGPTANQCEAEARQLGFSHVDVGAELCRRWGLDDGLVEAVSCHHKPFKGSDNSSAELPPLVKVSSVATLCADYLEASRGGHVADRTVVDQILHETFSFSDNDVIVFLQDIPVRVGEFSAMFSIDIGTAPSFNHLLATSKSMLEGLAVQSQMEAMAASQRAERISARLTQLEKHREQWRNEANRDPLTGAYNRRFMDTALRMEMQQCVERGSSMGVLFADIDKFKGLNDTYGHAAGDAALTTVSRVLHESTRDSDIVIRYGGDEFVVIFIEVTYEKLRQVADRICKRIRKSCLDCGEKVRLTGSVGGVFYAPQPGTSLEPNDLMREVDCAMYEAKKRGGNRVHINQMSVHCATIETYGRNK